MDLRGNMFPRPYLLINEVIVYTFAISSVLFLQMYPSRLSEEDSNIISIHECVKLASDCNIKKILFY